MTTVTKNNMLIYETDVTPAHYKGAKTVTIEVTKYSETSYGHFPFSDDYIYTPDHLTVARWHVKPKLVDVAIANIITSAAKSCRP